MPIQNTFVSSAVQATHGIAPRVERDQTETDSVATFGRDARVTAPKRDTHATSQPSGLWQTFRAKTAPFRQWANTTKSGLRFQAAIVASIGVFFAVFSRGLTRTALVAFFAYTAGKGLQESKQSSPNAANV